MNRVGLCTLDFSEVWKALYTDRPTGSRRRIWPKFAFLPGKAMLPGPAGKLLANRPPVLRPFPAKSEIEAPAAMEQFMAVAEVAVVEPDGLVGALIEARAPAW